MKTFTKVSLSVALISLGIGIGLLIIAAGRGHSSQYTPKFTMEDTVSDVSGLDIHMEVGELIITQGDEFRIEAQNLYRKDDLESYVSDGVWVIKHKYNEGIHLFGYNLPLSINIFNYKSPKIIITIPRDFQAEDIKVSMNAGSLKAQYLHSNTAYFYMDAGSMDIDGLTVEEESSYIVNAGQIKLERVDIRNIIVECDAGSVSLEGIVTGDNDIQCNMGKISLDLDDNVDLYSFDIDSDIGNVIINNKSYKNYKKSIKNEGYKGSFRLTVDFGNINMKFKKY